jgi:RNA recognition motif-containing protein
MRIYVGNLSYETSQGDVRDVFEQFGTVKHVSIVTDRDTGRSRGFGFVEMSGDEEARAAIDGLSGVELAGRLLTVNEAKPRAARGERPAVGDGVPVADDRR